MASKSISGIVEDMAAGREIHFNDLAKVCDHYFGQPRQQGDPRVNIQNDKGKAKPYQIRQVLKAIAKVDELAQAKKPK